MSGYNNHIYITYKWRYKYSRKGIPYQTTIDQQDGSERHRRAPLLRQPLFCGETGVYGCCCCFRADKTNMEEEKESDLSNSAADSYSVTGFLIGDDHLSEDVPIVPNTSNGTVTGRSLPSDSRSPCLIGVAGGSASGKVSL